MIGPKASFIQRFHHKIGGPKVSFIQGFQQWKLSGVFYSEVPPVETLNKGRFGTNHFVLCREVVFF